ncbi:VOC family protein [Flavobacterium sp.]|uniref:VOC family protein n=1 Tax=Flavobacterium sp. TaxID=239 RepID=UPI00286E71A2|nr:VOC family protein [Flavobacterium sp.]
MEKPYKIPIQTCIGHVHLKVSNLQRSLDFYCDLLGFEITTMYGTEAAFVSAGGYHHHIGLNTWYSEDYPMAQKKGVGLFHTAILYPTRKDLATIYNRLLQINYHITGSADHGVSQAIYLNDPDNNGVELYWDKPKVEWLYNEDGTLIMYSAVLDLDDLLKEII